MIGIRGNTRKNMENCQHNNLRIAVYNGMILEVYSNTRSKPDFLR